MPDGTITATRRDDGTVSLVRTAGRLLVSFKVLAEADPQWLCIHDGLVIFRGVGDDGSGQVYVYRPAGVEGGAEGGWLVCEPVS